MINSLFEFLLDIKIEHWIIIIAGLYISVFGHKAISIIKEIKREQ